MTAGAGVIPAAPPLVDRGPCPLCGSDDADVLHPFRTIPVVRCRGCRFIHSARVMPPEASARYYAESFGSDRHRKGQVVNARVNLAAIRVLLGPGPVGTFLDVGAGYGFLVRALRDRLGIDARGIEPSAREADHAREILGVEVRPGLLAESGYERASFDVVASFEVIEHVERPVEFVRELAAYVRPGGRLLVMTDNFDAAVVRRMGATWPKWIPHSHVSHFSPETLVACVEQAGPLEVEATLSYTPWENLAASLLARPRPAEEAFDLDNVLATEMGGRYRLCAVRRALNPFWFALTRRRDLSGALMYVVATARKG